ncbi:cysteine synthase A [Leucobacter sp. Z1108]|uniref:cysteine synthase A n=1 Tax=unclassified Leucobacter TaxID=2621730 RepID=UPI003D991020
MSTVSKPQIAKDVTELVGATPLVQINRLVAPGGARVLGKFEAFNPGGSIKDRTALSIVEAAESDGRLKPGGTVLEATSGNTGIALAWIGAVKGYKVIIVMPDDVSQERRTLLRALGAELVLTPGPEAMAGANQEAGRILERTPGAFLSGQGGNDANPAVHERTTGPEIWNATEGKIDMFVSTVGTGGTLTGVGRYLRSQNPDVQLVAVQPAEAPVLTGGEFHPHKIQGIIGGNGFPPVLEIELANEILSIPQDLAIETARAALAREGLLVGISGGANLAAAKELAERPENAGKTIVTMLCDTGERYLSTDLFAHVREA